MTLSQFGNLLKDATDRVWHYEALKQEPPYIVWTEYRRGGFRADSVLYSGTYRIQVSLFVKDEYDPVVDKLDNVLIENGISYTYLARFEPDTRVIHHVFDCEVSDGEI